MPTLKKTQSEVLLIQQPQSFQLLLGETITISLPITSSEYQYLKNNEKLCERLQAQHRIKINYAENMLFQDYSPFGQSQFTAFAAFG